MTDITFVPNVTTIDASWLQPVNDLLNDVFDGATTKTQAANAISAVTTLTNVGTGDGDVIRNETPTGTYNLKTIKAGTGITVTNNTDDITLTSSFVSPTQTTMQVITTAGAQIWTKPAGCQYIKIEVIGAGGGAGGVAASVGEGSGGGGGGGYAVEWLDATLSVTESVFIGSGGIGGIGASNGADGTASNFVNAAFCQATGGFGGKNLGSGNGAGGNKGVGATGELLGAGTPGSPGIQGTGGGHGGSSQIGGGAPGQIASSGNGSDATFAGCGGGGARSNGGAFNGGAGADGMVIVTEYYI